MNIKTALILSPHTDDAEFGCGGTIARLVQCGTDVYTATFSIINKEDIPEETLKEEAMLSSDRLKTIPFFYNYNMRLFHEFRQDILDTLFGLKELISPDIVFMPSLHDVHSDHRVVACEGMRAFKDTTILGYEMPRNNVSFNQAAFIGISRDNLQTKKHALAAYVSQKDKDYMSPHYIEALAVSRGVQAGKQLAEAFEVVRWIM